MSKTIDLKFEFKDEGCLVSLKNEGLDSGKLIVYGPDFDSGLLVAIDNIFKKNRIKKPYFFRVHTKGSLPQQAMAKSLVETLKKAGKI
jgi:hypothetical protein